jgi:hypothetical protein
MTRRCGQVRWALAAAAMLAVAALAAGCSSTPGARASAPGARVSGVPGPADSGSAPLLPAASRGAARQPSQFISLRLEPRRLRASNPASYLEVAVSNSTTGAIIRRLLPASRDGMRVTGLALDRTGNLWITYSRGPVSRGDTEGGDPRPDSCGNMITILHAGTGRVTTFLRTGDSVLISGAAPSPDGRLLAYGESGCATGYLDSYLRVTDLGTGRSWTIGQGLPRCHLITDPSWSTDGRALIVGYAPAAKPAYSGPQGTCLQPRRERVVSLATGAAQPGLAGAAAEADPGCQITSAAGAAGGGILAIEACGRGGYLQGRARLLVFGPRLGLARRITLGACTDGNELSADPSGGSVLVSAYLYCNPPGRPGPVTRLWSYAGGALRLVTSVPGDSMGVSLMTW